MRKLKVLATIFILIILIVTVFSLVTHFQHRNFATIKVSVLPSDSTVKLNGVSISKRTLYLEPGSYKLEASKNGFSSDSQTINAKKSKTYNVYLTPTPTSSAGFAWAKKNPDQEVERERLAQIEQDQLQVLLHSKYPLLKYLPLDTVTYKITYGPSEKYPTSSDKVAIYITSVQQTRQMALDWIKYKGFNPADYEIVYKNP